MKRRVLKIWVKQLLTLVVILFTAFVYLQAIKVGENITTPIDEIIMILCWGWLLLGQALVYIMIWEN